MGREGPSFVGREGALDQQAREAAFRDAPVLGARRYRDHSTSSDVVGQRPDPETAARLRTRHGGLMAQSTVRDEALLEDVADFTHAVIAYVDPQGYPLNVATDFEVDIDRNVIRLDRPSVPDLPISGAEVN